MKLPDYLVVGECKCGTSFAYYHLIQHPQILETLGNGIDDYLGTKELRFFDRYYSKGLDWYKSRFPDTKENEIVGEGASVYFGRMISLYRIKKDLPHVKIIVLLRNPVDRLYSHFCHMQKWIPGWKNKYDSFENFINSAREEDNYIIEKGIYISALSRWMDMFKEQLAIIKSEEFFEQSQKTCDSIFEHLEIEPFKLKNFKKMNSSTTSHIKQETREMLLDFYKPYNKQLCDLLGCETIWENQEENNV